MQRLPGMDADLASELMDAFAIRTGLTGGQQRRYLWTDAFAVCNFIGLSRATNTPRYRELARHLVDRVHHVLGRHRADDARSGWISGLSEADGEAHPTLGGLRIGKPLPERAIGQPIDERLEWDRDGQYFHYLTKWMYALRQLARATGEDRLATWARELADAAHRTFVHGGAHKRMYWKLSIDLTRPLVPSMGQHDPLDGYVTYRELDGEPLHDAIADFRAMIDHGALATADPLGLGGLLVDAYRLERTGRDAALAAELLDAAHVGLRAYAAQPKQRLEYRLAFRELGLAIGLLAVARMTAPLAKRFLPVRGMAGELAALWAQQRASAAWTEHADINDVMLATCFVPDGFLGDSG